MSQLKIFMTGRFRIEGPNGEDLTPKGAKECGLVALLLESRDGTRTRGWLQSHLWSDRGQDQAASSLRQAVYQLKRSLGPNSSTIFSDRLCVGCYLDEIEVVDNPDYEFLEGIGVRDKEFERWLTVARATRLKNDQSANDGYSSDGSRLLPVSRVYVRFNFENADPIASRWLGQLTGDLITRSLTESLDIYVDRNPPYRDELGLWRIDIEVATDGSEGHLIRLAIVEVATGKSLWAQHESIVSRDPDVSQREEVIVLVQRFVTAFLELYLESLDGADLLSRADALCQMGIGKLFSMQTELVGEADQLFSDAFALKERGIFLAWRAQVRQVQLLERIGPDAPTLREEAESFARRAFEVEPNNSTVVALLAVNRLHFGRELEAAMDYACRSVKLNFSNAVAWWALSDCHLKSENYVKAYGAARMAVNLSQGTSFEFWTLSLLSGAAIAINKMAEAKRVLKNVSFGRPNFRPPVRHLLAIHATDEEWEDAVAAVERLKQLEPEFSIERFANDKNYPMSLLHKSSGLNRDRVLELI